MGLEALPRDRFLKVAEVARALGVSPRTVRRWIRRGRLAALKASPRLFLVHPRDLDEMIERMRVRPGEEGDPQSNS